MPRNAHCFWRMLNRGRGVVPRPAGRWLLITVSLSALISGCKSNKRYDLIEAELRTRDSELRETRGALEQSRLLNQAYEQQLRTHQAHAGRPDPVAGGPVIIPVTELTLGRGTGGLDRDDCPGDEALQVVMIPKDGEGSAVKVPGRALVAAWEVSPQGLKTPIGSWDVTPAVLRNSWRAGLLSTGYFLTLPWQTFPNSDRLRVAVRFTTLDGRVFEADRDVSVRPQPAQLQKGGAPVQPGAELPLPGGLTPPPVPGLSVVPPLFPPAREPLPPAATPPGVPPSVPSVRPPDVEELPPPSPGPERKAMLLPPTGL